MFRASSVHLQEALHCSFWCELRALVAVVGCKLWVDWFIGLGGLGVGPVAWYGAPCPVGRNQLLHRFVFTAILLWNRLFMMVVGLNL
jgi:hypothetical protein